MRTRGRPSRRSRAARRSRGPVVVSGTTAPAFAPVASAFGRLVARGPGGGALAVRLRGETVVDLWTGSADRRGARPWTPDTVAISFSTTKGVASTIVHRLADRGELGYDEPVATYWPEFAAGGKERVTVRDLLTHRAGLHDVRAVADSAEELLDHLAMEERLAARAVRAPTERSAYHAITYGWLVAGLARRVTGQGLGGARAAARSPVRWASGGCTSASPRRRTSSWPSPSALRCAMRARSCGSSHRCGPGRAPPARGSMRCSSRAFTGCSKARDLRSGRPRCPRSTGSSAPARSPRLYGALANGGTDAGARLLSPETTNALGRVQVRTRDAVLGVRMRWRLGYHHAFGTGSDAPHAFGHYGYGGSGGWADPELGLSLGFVTNRVGSVSTPMGDLDLFRLSRVVRRCALGAGSYPVQP